MARSDLPFPLDCSLAFTLLLPQLRQTSAYNHFSFDLNWTAAENEQVTRTDLPVLRCPSSDGLLRQNGCFEHGVTDYAFSRGNPAWLCMAPVTLGMFDINSRVRAGDITDGLSSTFAMGDVLTSERLSALLP